MIKTLRRFEKNGLTTVSGAKAKAWLRRFRYKLALPSVLMGLVVFSFTLLGFGAVVYTTALPSLVAVAEQDDGAYSQLTHSIENAVNGGLATGETTANGESASGSNASALRPSVTSSGLTLGNLADVSGITQPEASAQDQGEDQDAQDDAAEDNDEEIEGGDQDAANPAPPAEDEPTQPDTPTGPDPEAEQAAYNHLLSEFQAIEGYIGQVNACVQAFNNDNQANLDTRLAHQRENAALYTMLHSHYAGLLGYALPEGSQYGSARGSLIAMYRCLSSYVGVIDSAWTLNVQFEDPENHVDEYMVPIRGSEVDGVNKYLAEFYSRYEGFVL